MNGLRRRWGIVTYPEMAAIEVSLWRYINSQPGLTITNVSLLLLW